MRIAFLSTGHPTQDRYPEGGGIQYEIEGLAGELARRGHEVHILARSVQLRTDDGVQFHEVSAPGKNEILSVIDFGRRALEHIQRINPDILYLSERFSAAFAARFPRPKVFAFHNSDGVRPYWRFAVGHNPVNLAVFPFKSRLEEYVMGRCERVIVPGRSWIPYLVSRGIENGTVIGHGLRVEDYECRGDGGFLLFAGRLSRVKGLDTLFHAYAHLNPRMRVPLLLAGAGPEESELRRLAMKLGIQDRLVFLGHVSREELRSLFATCMAVILPSRWESFGLTAAEGMASGKPVIASDVPGPRDYIRAGENGLLFRSGDVETLARLLATVIQDGDLRRRLGSAALRDARKEFPFSVVAAEHERLYTEILATRGGAS